MIVEIQLGRADRDRLGCGEWLPVDLHSVTVREAIVLQHGVDLGDAVAVQFDTPAAWRAALAGRSDETGQRRGDFGAELVLVWLALRRGGVTLPLAGVEYDADSREFRVVESDEATPGKDPSIPDTTLDDDSGGISPA